MKKEIVKMLALLLFGAAAISSCAVDNNRHGRYHNYRHHGYGNGGNDHDGYYNRDNNHGGYNHSNY